VDTIALLVILAANLCGPRVYAEIEFYMSSIKVITIVGLIILGIVIDAGGAPSHDPIGFRYWRNPGPFVQYKGIEGSTGRVLGFFSGLTGAAFASIGAEMLCRAAAETKRPRKVLPVALQATWKRIILFYSCGAFVVSLIVPSDDPRFGIRVDRRCESVHHRHHRRGNQGPPEHHQRLYPHLGNVNGHRRLLHSRANPSPDGGRRDGAKDLRQNLPLGVTLRRRFDNLAMGSTRE
jgi:hypothetical protein